MQRWRRELIGLGAAGWLAATGLNNTDHYRWFYVGSTGLLIAWGLLLLGTMLIDYAIAAVRRKDQP